MDWTEAVVTVVLLAGSLCMFLLLAALTWLSWRGLRARAAAEKEALRALGNRLIAALWMVAVPLVATVIFQETRSAAAGLPSLWSPGATASVYGRALVFLPLGAYLLLAQAIVGLTVLTWQLPAFAGKRRPSDLGAAMVSASGLAASLLALVTIALVTVVRLSAQGVSP
jgi:hypothetical protein